MDRRSFLKSTTASIGLFSIVPSYVLGQNGKTPPSGKLNIAAIGVGGIGQSNLKVICKPLSQRQEDGAWPDPDSQILLRCVMWIGSMPRKLLTSFLKPNAIKIIE